MDIVRSTRGGSGVRIDALFGMLASLYRSHYDTEYYHENGCDSPNCESFSDAPASDRNEQKISGKYTNRKP